MSVRSVIAVVLLLLVAGCGGKEPVVGDVQIHDPDGLHGSVLPEPYQLPAATLTDSHGQPFELRQGVTRPLTLVFFGYTHCPDICGQVMATLAGTLARLDDEQKDRLDVVFVTTDPARDDEAAVEDYVDAFDPSITGLTGDLDDIVEVGRSMAVGVDKGEKLPSGGYEVTHGTQVIGIDASDQAPVYWNADVSQAQLAHDVTAILDGELEQG